MQVEQEKSVAHKRKHDELSETSGKEKEENKTKKSRHSSVDHPVGNPDNSAFLIELVSRTVDTITINPENKLFVASKSDKIYEVFKGLIEQKFLSVPIQGKREHKYYGFIDLADIVRYVVDHFGGEKLTSTQDFSECFKEEKTFQEKTVEDLMQFPHSMRTRFHAIKTGYSLFSAVEAMAKEEDIDRLAIVDGDRSLISVLTRSRVIEFLSSMLDKVGHNKLIMKVGDIEGVKREVPCVDGSKMAVEAFHMMVEKNVGGVGVITKEGRLKANLSLRDLRAMSHDASLFWRLYQTVDAFLDKVKHEYSLKTKRPRTIQTVKEGDTLAHAIEKLAKYRIHHLFVVNAEKKPVGMVTIRDILKIVISP